MKNKLLIDTSIFALVLFTLFLFFQSSFSNNRPDTQVSISVDTANLEFNKEQIESDLITLNSVESVEVSIEVGLILMEVDNNAFNPKSVRKVLDKWGINSKDDWDIEIIASSEF